MYAVRTVFVLNSELPMVLSSSALFKSTLHAFLYAMLLLESVHIVAFQSVLQQLSSTKISVRNPTVNKGGLSSSSLFMSDRVPYVPYYPSKSSKDYQWMDIYNALGRDRTLFIGRYLDEEACNQLIASLIWCVYNLRSKEII